MIIIQYWCQFGFVSVRAFSNHVGILLQYEQWRLDAAQKSRSVWNHVDNTWPETDHREPTGTVEWPSEGIVETSRWDIDKARSAIFSCLNSSWEQSGDLPVCVRECGDWEDSDPVWGSQDKTQPATESGQESQDTGHNVCSSPWTSYQVGNNIFSKYEEHWSGPCRRVVPWS